MRKGLVSTIIISVLCTFNLFFTCFLHLPFNIEEFLGNNQVNIKEENFYAAMLMAGIAGMFLLMVYAWMLLIMVMHSVCLIFTIRNRKASLKWVRIYNYVLDVVNGFLITAPLVKIIMNLNWSMIFG